MKMDMNKIHLKIYNVVIINILVSVFMCLFLLAGCGYKEEPDTIKNAAVTNKPNAINNALSKDSPAATYNALSTDAPVTTDSTIATEIPATGSSISTDMSDTDTSVVMKQAVKPTKDIKICIDPGHYNGHNLVNGKESYQYDEGNFTLKIALRLKKILTKQYGVKVILTRDSENININGYENEELDNGKIDLRGEFAGKKNCDLFISLHTNANEDNANDSPTCEQPLSITKTIMLVNQLCYKNEKWLKVANEIGSRLSTVNMKLGLASNDNFISVTDNTIKEWSKKYNDSLDEAGTVMYRNGKKGDYYGVLHGATEAGVPGMIIEHGYHTVPEMRKAAAKQELWKAWAEADAEGIAAGLGLQ